MPRALLLASLLALLMAGCTRLYLSATPPTISDSPTPAFSPSPSASPLPIKGGGDLLLLSIEENGYAHLFAYLPETLQWIRLTDGEWSDTAPALHPGSRQIAFASNRNGHWNIFLLDWPRAQINQLTNYPTYAASPSWSPDGRWLAFTAYLHDNLEIAILSMANPQQEPIRLTNDPAADSSPAWAPGGRQIAFVSTRSGNNDIWLADLDKTGDDRFRNLSQTPMVTERLPRWSPDGKKLLWAANAQDGSLSGIYLWDGENPHRPARWLCSGDQAAWDPQGQRLAVISTTPQASFLTFYDLQGNPLAPPARLPGRVRGMIWISEALPSPLPEAYSLAAEVTPSAPWAPVLTPRAPGQRWSLVTLPDLQAPYPQFHDLVDEAFQALRQRVLKETGWDALGTLEYAFVPLTVPLDPGYSRDWLYTGRAFALPFALNDSGWMVAIPEEIAGQTYWTVYLRSRQTGAGIAEPLSDAPWDFSARYSLEPQFYEQGGRFAPVPPGYWVNLTALAQAYGWERLPALPNWRNYVRGARFNQFVLRGGLDWYQAMLELYPPDILITPTPVQPPTLTPTPTPTHTPTPRPTWTPRPTRTPSSTPSPIPTNTPLP